MAFGDKMRLPFTEATMDSGSYYTNGFARLTFSANLVASNVYNLSINGVALSATTYATSNAATMSAINTKIAALANIGSSRVIDANTIDIWATKSATVVIDTQTGIFLQGETLTFNSSQTATLVNQNGNVLTIKGLSASLGSTPDNYTVVGGTSGATALINGTSAGFNGSGSVVYNDLDNVPLFITGSIVTLGATQATTSFSNQAGGQIAIPMIYACDGTPAPLTTTVEFHATTMSSAITAANAGLALLPTKRVTGYSSVWDSTNFYLTYTIV